MSGYKRIFTIPVGDRLSKDESEKLIEEMSKNVVWDGRIFSSPSLKRKERRKKFSRILND